MLKKYVSFITLFFIATTLWGQEKCPSFKIRGNKSPRSNAFTTAIKFQLDGLAQYQGITPQYAKHLRFYPALSMGLEQSLSRKLSISALHGWSFSPNAYNSRFIAGDVRYYFDQCFENKWLSSRITWTETPPSEFEGGVQPFVSIHYGNTARLKRIFTHYEMGIGFGQNNVLVFSLGVATGLKL
jgi:hypothetical protein